MIIQQVLVACVCLVFNSQQIGAVVNNGQNSSEDSSIANVTIITANSTNENTIADLIAENTDLEEQRRTAPLGLSDSYGVPLLSQDSYVPSLASNLGLPPPVYGVPDQLINNIVYPSPPPDIPPPISPSFSGPPKSAFPLPSIRYGPPRPFKQFYPPKPIYGPPRHQYGPPNKPLFVPPKYTKPLYGPPFRSVKPHYGPPKPIFAPAQPSHNYGPPLGPPKGIYIPPKITNGPLLPQYGPPQHVPHGPPYPGISAPPTPPDIKYDGWQPIVGLVSKVPHATYGVPSAEIQNGNSFQFNRDLVPPPSNGHSSEFKGDSYSAPLNSVTGSGGTVISSGSDHSQVGLGVNQNIDQNNLSVVKSVGYEIYPNTGGISLQDAYGTSQLNGYAANVPFSDAYSFTAAQPIDNFASSIASSFETSFLDTALTQSASLIPPSGVYGVSPSGKYGTPLLHQSLPKNPVVFRDPVPPGLLHGIGNSVAQKDAHGVIENINLNDNGGSAYISPPVPDLTGPSKEPASLSTLYSLPIKNSGNFINNYAFNSGNFDAFGYAGLGTYATPHTNIHNTYGVPQAQAQVGTPPGAYFTTYQNSVHDCSKNSQPQNSLVFTAPSSDSYTASLSSLNTNIAGAYQSPPPVLNYGAPDLNGAYSQSTGTISQSDTNNLVEATGKSLAKDFGTDSELIKSESIDLNSIPLQGALGSYTLQIQPSDVSQGSTGVRHEQVLNDGLLQSILSAIEQPQYKAASILGHPLLHLQQVPQQIAASEDSVAQTSVSQNVLVAPPLSTKDRERFKSEGKLQSDRDKKLLLIDDNEIALYFTNTENPNEQNPKRSSTETTIRNIDYSHHGSKNLTLEANIKF